MHVRKRANANKNERWKETICFGANVEHVNKQFVWNKFKWVIHNHECVSSKLSKYYYCESKRMCRLRINRHRENERGPGGRRQYRVHVNDMNPLSQDRAAIPDGLRHERKIFEINDVHRTLDDRYGHWSAVEWKDLSTYSTLLASATECGHCKRLNGVRH